MNDEELHAKDDEKSLIKEVIPQKDRALLEPLIKEANKEAINQYAILSSLSGFTGTFQKIGFSGLPLATVTLTLIFSFLSFFQQEFIELAKLTLGAFIGSFVQKGQDQLKMAKQDNEINRYKALHRPKTATRFLVG